MAQTQSVTLNELEAENLAVAVAVSGDTTLLELDVKGIDELGVEVSPVTNSLDAFKIYGKFHQNSDYQLLFDSSGDFTSPLGLLIGASGDLTALAAAATGWFFMDVTPLYGEDHCVCDRRCVDGHGPREREGDWLMARAWNPRFQAGRKHRWRQSPAGGAPEGYEGPLDIVPGAMLAYGQRALSAAMRGQPLYTIREDGGDTEQAFNSDAVTGDAPVAAITAFLDGAGGFVKTWNDQSGNAKHATASEEADWLPNQVGSIPALVVHRNSEYDGSGIYDIPSITWGGSYTVFFVSSYGGGEIFAQETDPYFDVAPGPGAFNETSDGVNNTGSNYSDELIPEYEFVVWDTTFEFGTNTYMANGQALVGEPHDVGGALDPFTSVAQLYLNGVSAEEEEIQRLAEVIVYPSILSDAQRLAIRQNIAAYYSLTLAP